MGSFIDEDDDDVNTECRFFDAEEGIASVSDSDPGCSSFRDSDSGVENWEPGNFLYDVWIRSPRSIDERRNEFLSWMGVDLHKVPRDDADDECGYVEDVFRQESIDRVVEDVFRQESIDRVMEDSSAVLRNSILEDEFSSSRSTMSSWSTDALDSVGESGAKRRNFLTSCIPDCRIECNGNKLEEGLEQSTNESNHLPSPQEARRKTNVHPVSRGYVQRVIENPGNSAEIAAGLKSRLLRRLRSMSCIMVQPELSDDGGNSGSIPAVGTKVQRIKVRHSKKRLKELSALFKGQNIQAHEGSILAMKFSFDGQYLASAGEDKVVRVWQVVEDERANDIDIPDIDPSCLYFTVNHLSELAPLVADKDKISKSKSLRKSSDSACIIFPPKVFRIREEPLHEFRGHTAEVLDLSWSKNNCLLSSSVDKTVRLWKVGCDQCLSIFPHSNYVTCAQFNPANDNCFVTGSIDGKVRIWEISARRVIDWTDIRDIITAICYRPDGEGGIIGSMTGNCSIFTVADNHLQLEPQICLSPKKKSPCKRITSFQFSPKDSSKILVTSADSQVRILSRGNVIVKYRGPRSAGNHISASFTSDGKHMISSSEDSNVYMWDSCNLDDFSPSQPKTVRSFECFPADASVVAPWFGMKTGNSGDTQQSDQNSTEKLPFSPTCFSLGQEFFLESIPRGSATWPEENLPDSSSHSVASIMSKTQFKFLKTSFQSLTNSHAWGMVIVAAGWDGRIRSFHNYGLPIPT